MSEAMTRPALAGSFQEVVEVARQGGATLQDVYEGMADELGRTSANLTDEADIARALVGFMRLALAAWRVERAVIERAQEPSYGGEGRRRRR